MQTIASKSKLNRLVKRGPRILKVPAIISFSVPRVFGAW
jgi:hypothetical protein